MEREKKSRKPIPDTVKRRLIAKAAGRCEFPGCNKFVYEDELTLENSNCSNIAHIISYEQNGPRGNEAPDMSVEERNSEENLMLLCRDHHSLIDDKPKKYTADKLRQYKKEHEKRIELVTSICPERRAYIVTYTAPIAGRNPHIVTSFAKDALLPDYYPAVRNPIDLSPVPANDCDYSEKWYSGKADELKNDFQKCIERKFSGDNSAQFAVFAIAPMSLLIQLGVLMDEKKKVQVYQPQRDGTCRWNATAGVRRFKINRPVETEGKKLALLLTLTQEIDNSLVADALGGDFALWHITSDYQGVDCIQSMEQLNEFSGVVRTVLDEILQVDKNVPPIHVFPIMQTSACVAFGRLRSSAHNPWTIYERRRGTDGFVKTLDIN